MLHEMSLRYIVSVMSLRKLIWISTLLTIATIGFFSFSAANTAETAQNLTIHLEDNSSENSWTKTLRDTNWRAYLSPEVKNTLNIENTNAPSNPYAALHNSGVTPMVSTENGVALWGNCRTINASTIFESSLPQKNELFDVVDGVTEVVSGYTGLQVSHSSTYKSVQIDHTNLPSPEKGSILIIWVSRDSEALSSQQLGTTEVWHTIESDGTPTITRARILLSEKIIERYDMGLIGRDDNIETAVMHELVHAMGIGHSTHKNSFMHTELANETFATSADIAAMAFAGSRSC